MLRALAVLRWVFLLVSLGYNLIVRFQNFSHPYAALACLVVMTIWTGLVAWIYARRKAWMRVALVIDLALAVGLILITLWVKGPWFNATLPGFWVSAAMIAWAIHWRVAGGLIAAICIGVADLSIRGGPDQGEVGNVILILIGGLVIGYLADSIQRMAAERDAAQLAAASAAERARLSRAVHDGVLQVLALVQRRGPALGPDGAELGRLAGEQEDALRALIREQDHSRPAAADLDLIAAIDQVTKGRQLTLHRATPGTDVHVPAEVGRELAAAVGACLDNVATHVGPSAPAWILVEDLTDRVVVTVRDEGPGMAADRADSAEREGRLGISGSIRGRLRDLGGTAELVTAPGQGVEWELGWPRGER